MEQPIAEPGNAFVAKVVETEIMNPEELAGARERRSDSPWRVGKDQLGTVRHGLDHV